jgi:peptidyl-prolyl cis-trans isomerase SurA
MTARAQAMASAAAAMLAVMLTATSAWAQADAPSPTTQSTPPTASPTSPNQQTGTTSTTTRGPSGTLEMQQSTGQPEENKPAPQDDSLTFLPELKPTDGVVALAPQRSGDAQIAGEANAMHEKPMLLDRAVAVINGEVLLESDVRDQQHFAVFEPYSVPGGEFTPMQAMQQLVNRTLLQEQMAEQELVPPPSDEAVDQQIEELRRHIPACAGQSCETEEGWHRFLLAHGFDEALLHRRWRQRMQILTFIGVRFRTGIRIAKPEIETYYREKLVPQFQARKLTPPPLAKVSDRIDEVLLQQHVNVLLNDYLVSLKDAGSVQILDPQYNSLGKSPAASPASGTDLPGSPRSGGEQ